MIKLIALFRKPDDPAAFDKHYWEVHAPLVRKVPGLRKYEVTNITGSPIGEAKYYLMAEMYFDSSDAMNAGNASPEGKAVAKDAMSFAASYMTILFGQVKE